MSNLLAQITNPIIGDYGKLDKVQVNPLALFFVNIWRAMVIFGALITIIYLIWGTLDWLTSEGDQEKLKGARTKMVNAVIGMGLLAASAAIVILIDKLGVLGFKLLELKWPTP